MTSKNTSITAQFGANLCSPGMAALADRISRAKQSWSSLQFECTEEEQALIVAALRGVACDASEFEDLRKANQILHGLITNRDAEIERLRDEAAGSPHHRAGCACDRCEGRPLSRSAHKGHAGGDLREPLDALLAFRHGDTKCLTSEHARVLFATLTRDVAQPPAMSAAGKLELAKLIDAEAWLAIQDGRDAIPHSNWANRRDWAQRKADTILSALPDLYSLPSTDRCGK